MKIVMRKVCLFITVHTVQVEGLCGNMDRSADNDISVNGVTTSLVEFAEKYR